MKGIFLVVMLTATLAKADELPSCDLKAFNSASILSGSESPTYGIKGLSLQKRHLASPEKSDSTSDFKTVLVNDALVNTEIRPTVLKPTKDFIYKANFLSKSINFTAGHEYVTMLKYTSPAGLNYDVLTFDARYHIFVGEDGIPCNKVAYVSYQTSVVVIHKYSMDPTDAQFEKSLSVSNPNTTGIRIIYLGLDKGAMKFQGTLVKKGKITDSRAFTFDQFAKQIEIAGISIQVSKASSDAITAKVEL